MRGSANHRNRIPDSMLRRSQVKPGQQEQPGMPSRISNCRALAAVAVTVFVLAGFPASAQAAVQPIAAGDSALQLRAMAGLSIERINAHVFKPPHTLFIDSEDAADLPVTAVQTLPLKVAAKSLDANAFAAQLDGLLKGLTAGYAISLRKGGAPLITYVKPYARTPGNGGTAWSLDTRMHIASVSKFITAVATAAALAQQGSNADRKIQVDLPFRWHLGNNVNQITYRHLLTHGSGFVTGGSASDYETMKWKVYTGAGAVGSYHYENMNFGLCRLLIPVLVGNISRDHRFPPQVDQDKAWDAATIEHYKNFVQSTVFNRAGVSNASFAPAGPSGALAYGMPAAGGWDSGDLATMSGGAGWRLSVNELMKVMNTFRRKGTIMSPAAAQALLDSKFGIDNIFQTPLGNMYVKNGRWRRNGQTEQCVAFFLPQDMELVVFVNSPIGVSGESLKGLVKTLYLNNLK